MATAQTLQDYLDRLGSLEAQAKAMPSLLADVARQSTAALSELSGRLSALKTETIEVEKKMSGLKSIIPGMQQGIGIGGGLPRVGTAGSPNSQGGVVTFDLRTLEMAQSTSREGA